MRVGSRAQGSALSEARVERMVRTRVDVGKLVGSWKSF